MASKKEKLAKEIHSLTGIDEKELLTKTLKDLNEMLEEAKTAIDSDEADTYAEQEREVNEAENASEPRSEEPEGGKPVADAVEEPKDVKIVEKPREESHEVRHMLVMNRNVRYNGKLYKKGETLENFEVKRFFLKMGYAE